MVRYSIKNFPAQEKDNQRKAEKLQSKSYRKLSMASQFAQKVSHIDVIELIARGICGDFFDLQRIFRPIDENKFATGYKCFSIFSTRFLSILILAYFLSFASIIVHGA